MALRYRPTLEGLENRATPAVILTQLDLDGDDLGAADDIRIRGDAGNNLITITDGGNGVGILAIDANGDGDFKDKALGDVQMFLETASNSMVFDIRLGGGNDQVLYRVGGAYEAGTRSFNVSLGSGADEFQFDMLDQDVGSGFGLTFAVDAGAGNDVVDWIFQGIRDSAVSIQASLGSGNDRTSLSVLNDIDDGAAVSLAYDLGAGANHMTAMFQGIGKFDQAAVSLDLLGGSDRDDVTVSVSDDVGDGQTPSRLSITSQLFAGNDQFAMFLNHSDFKVDDGSQVQVRVHGGTGNDRLALEPDIGGQVMDIDTAALLDLEFHGDAGNDKVQVLVSPFDAFGILGTLRVHLDGGSGTDQVQAELANSNDTTGSYDVALTGGSGDDRIVFDLRRNLGSPTFGPAGFIVLDGGAGIDTLVNAAGTTNVTTRFLEKESI